MKKRPKISPKTKAILQKEINSECPICQNQEVEYFEIHHIDENPENNVLTNLLLLCSNCHTKITKGDISEYKIKQIKSDLPLMINSLQFVSAVIESDSCAWEVSDKNDFAFFRTDDKDKSPFPIINFTIINHGNKIVVLKKIQVNVKNLPRGISGIPQPTVLKALAIYQMQVASEKNVLNLPNPIHVPPNESFMFQIELSEKLMAKNERYEIVGRKVLYFSFEFSNDVILKIPNLYLNCNSENEQMRIYFMH